MPLLLFRGPAAWPPRLGARRPRQPQWRVRPNRQRTLQPECPQLPAWHAAARYARPAPAADRPATVTLSLRPQPPAFSEEGHYGGRGFLDRSPGDVDQRPIVPGAKTP